MAALFRIVQDDYPPLPEGISQALRDFLFNCLQKEPVMRSSATKLLEHPWLHNSSMNSRVLEQQTNKFLGSSTNPMGSHSGIGGTSSSSSGVVPGVAGSGSGGGTHAGAGLATELVASSADSIVNTIRMHQREIAPLLAAAGVGGNSAGHTSSGGDGIAALHGSKDDDHRFSSSMSHDPHHHPLPHASHISPMRTILPNTPSTGTVKESTTTTKPEQKITPSPFIRGLMRSTSNHDMRAMLNNNSSLNVTTSSSNAAMSTAENLQKRGLMRPGDHPSAISPMASNNNTRFHSQGIANTSNVGTITGMSTRSTGDAGVINTKQLVRVPSFDHVLPTDTASKNAANKNSGVAVDSGIQVVGGEDDDDENWDDDFVMEESGTTSTSVTPKMSATTMSHNFTTSGSGNDSDEADFSPGKATSSFTPSPVPTPTSVTGMKMGTISLASMNAHTANVGTRTQLNTISLAAASSAASASTTGSNAASSSKPPARVLQRSSSVSSTSSNVSTGEPIVAIGPTPNLPPPPGTKGVQISGQVMLKTFKEDSDNENYDDLFDERPSQIRNHTGKSLDDLDDFSSFDELDSQQSAAKKKSIRTAALMNLHQSSIKPTVPGSTGERAFVTIPSSMNMTIQRTLSKSDDFDDLEMPENIDSTSFAKKLRQKLSIAVANKDAFDTSTQQDEPDGFINYQFDEKDFKQNEQRDIHFRRSREVVELMSKVTSSNTEEDMILCGEQIISIFDEHPEQRDHLITYHGVMPIVDMFEAKPPSSYHPNMGGSSGRHHRRGNVSSSGAGSSSTGTPVDQRLMQYHVLRITNKIIEDSVRTQEQLSLVGIIPIVMTLFEKSCQPPSTPRNSSNNTTKRRVSSTSVVMSTSNHSLDGSNTSVSNVNSNNNVLQVSRGSSRSRFNELHGFGSMCSMDEDLLLDVNDDSDDDNTTTPTTGTNATALQAIEGNAREQAQRGQLTIKVTGPMSNAAQNLLLMGKSPANNTSNHSVDSISNLSERYEIDRLTMEAAKFIHQISLSSSLTLQMLIGAGGLGVLTMMVSFGSRITTTPSTASTPSSSSLTPSGTSSTTAANTSFNRRLPALSLNTIPSGSSASDSSIDEDAPTPKTGSSIVTSSLALAALQEDDDDDDVGKTIEFQQIEDLNVLDTMLASPAGSSAAGESMKVSASFDPIQDVMNQSIANITALETQSRKALQSAAQLAALQEERDNCMIIFQMGIDCISQVFDVQASRTRDFCRLFVKLGLLPHLAVSFDNLMRMFKTMLIVHCPLMMQGGNSSAQTPTGVTAATSTMSIQRYHSDSSLLSTTTNVTGSSSGNGNKSPVVGGVVRTLGNSTTTTANGNRKGESLSAVNSLEPNQFQAAIDGSNIDIVNCMERIYALAIAHLFFKFSRSDSIVSETMANIEKGGVIGVILSTLRAPELRYNNDLTTTLNKRSTRRNATLPAPYLEIIELLLKCLKNLSMEPSALDDLENAGTMETLVPLLSSPMSDQCKVNILPCLFNMCRVNRRRQELAATLGIIPHLKQLIEGRSHLRQFALPIMFDLAHTSNGTRQELWKNDCVSFYVDLLNENYWQKFALNSLSIW